MTAATANPIQDPEFARTFEEHVRSGYQLMYVQTSEESRVEMEISAVAQKQGFKVVMWDCYEGFRGNVSKNIEDDTKAKIVINALDYVADEEKFKSNPDYTIFIFRDLDDFMNDVHVRRRLRSLAEGNRLVNVNRRRPIVILSPAYQIPQKLRALIATIDFKLPDEERLKLQVDFVQSSIMDSAPEKAVLSPQLRSDLATNLLGLTVQEAENCLSRCLVRHGGFKPEMLDTVKEEKAAVIKKGEVLTYIPANSIQSREQIGGYDLYMSWLDMRRLAYTPEAREHKIDFPKGVMLVGIPGTGKSVAAKATCLVFNLPGYILDVGSLFGSMVGESEQRTRDVLKQIDAQKGCVLMLDEIDKAFGGATQSMGDSGVTRRVFGTILTWLSENKSRTFVVATANRVDVLPPEMTRAGRFDAMFYTDLPNDLERRQITEIHLRLRGVIPESLGFTENDWQSLLRATDKFVGSELEQVVCNARYAALKNRGNGVPTYEEFVEAANGLRPTTMMERDAESLQEILKFCKDKALPVTSPQVQQARRGRANRSVDVT